MQRAACPRREQLGECRNSGISSSPEARRVSQWPSPGHRLADKLAL